MDGTNQRSWRPSGFENAVVKMKIHIRQRDSVMTEKLRAHVLRRLGFALSRFGERVVSVIVRISRSKGRLGGLDTRCQIDVGLVRSVKATATDVNALASVNRATAGAGRSVARALERERETEQRPHVYRSAPRK